MKKATTEPSAWEKTIIKNTTHIAYWTLAWLASTALAAIGPSQIWSFDKTPTALAVLLNMAIGLGLVIAIFRHQKSLDDLGKKVFLDAAAITLGATLIIGTSYQMLQNIKLISSTPEVSHLILLMGITFMVSILVGNWRYR